MPRSEKELLKHDAQRNVGEELPQAIRGVKTSWYGTRYSANPPIPVPGTLVRQRTSRRYSRMQRRHSCCCCKRLTQLKGSRLTSISIPINRNTETRHRHPHRRKERGAGRH